MGYHLVLGLVLMSGFVSAQEVSVASEPVDLQKYLGKWFEIANIPHSFQSQCVANTTAEYTQGEDNLIVVINSCSTESGERSVAEGRARVQDEVSRAKLKVTFVKFIRWIFAFGGNYWILEVAPDYSYALVGEPSRKYAWILSRTPQMGEAELIRAEGLFKQNGYDTCAILTSIQDGGFKERKALCQLVSTFASK